jgi:prepilin-type processing-associated H-X9-DG protein
MSERNTSRRLPAIICLLALIGCSSATVAAAAAKGPKNAADKNVRLLLEEQALLVVRLDLDKVDAGAVGDWVTDVLKAAELGAAEEKQATEQVRGTAQAVDKWVGDIKQAGGRRVYYMLSLDDLPPLGGPPGYLVIPLGKDADADALTTFFSGQGGAGGDGPRSYGFPGPALGWEAAEVGDAVVVAGKERLEKLRGLKSTERAELTDALAAAATNGSGGPAVVAALVPSADVRKALEQTLPDLPPEAGGEPAATFTQGVAWAAIGLSLPPEPALRVVVQPQDRQAGDALLAWARKMLKTLSADEQLRREVPAAGEFLRAVKLGREGERVVLSLTPEQINKTVPALAAALRQARTGAAIAQSMNNLKQLVLSCFIYANEHKGAFPDDAAGLAEAVKSAGGVPEMLLVNPRQPQRGRDGYVYVKPSAGSRAGGTVVVIYEAFNDWPEGGIAVGFADGHVEVVPGEAEFRKHMEFTREVNAAGKKGK